MPKTMMTQDERQLVKLVEKMHLSEEDKAAFAERIRTGEMSEELAEEIRQKLAATDTGEQYAAIRTRHLAELAMLVKRWRLSSQSRNFGRK